MFIEIETDEGRSAFFRTSDVALILEIESGGSEIHLRGKSTRVTTKTSPEEVLSMLRTSDGEYLIEYGSCD